MESRPRSMRATAGRASTVLSALVLAFMVGMAPVVAIVDPDEVAPAVLDDGFYIEPGTDVSQSVVEDAVSAARFDGERLMLVVLDEDPNGGATTFADAVFDRLDVDGVVVVVAPATVGFAGEGSGYSAEQIDAALAAGEGDNDEFIRRFAGALTGELVGAPATSGVDVQDDPASSSSGGGGGILMFLLLLAVVGIIGFLWVRSRRRKVEMDQQGSLDEAKSEIQAQLDAVANDILDLAERVRVADDDRADEFYREASATYAAMLQDFEAATDLRALEAVSIRLDEAAWQLDAAEAVLEGRQVPAKPEPREPGRCFFDPTHPPPYEEAEIRTQAGSRIVKVCRADAAKLRAGEEPRSRMINVGGRRVPAASAPRTHGGLGMGGLDLFQVILGGVAQSMAYGRSRRRSSGGLGGMLGGRASRPQRPEPSGGGIFGGGLFGSSGRSSRPRAGSTSRSRGSKPSAGRSPRSRSGRIRGGTKRRR